MFDDITCFILAGGKSSRFGMDKALVRLGDKTMIEIILDKVINLFPNIFIITNNPSEYKFAGFPLISDLIKDLGPISGIHTGLSNTETIKNFFLSCDLPFITSEAINYICSIDSTKQISVPMANGRLHPFCGVYRKEFLKIIEPIISNHLVTTDSKNEDFRISGVLNQIESEIINFESLPFYNKDLFFNMNTKEDYRIVKSLVES